MKSVSRCGKEIFCEKMLVPSFRSQRQRDQHLLYITQGLLSTSSCLNGGGYPYHWRKGDWNERPVFTYVLEQLLKRYLITHVWKHVQYAKVAQLLFQSTMVKEQHKCQLWAKKVTFQLKSFTHVWKQLLMRSGSWSRLSMRSRPLCKGGWAAISETSVQ
jgi:hypothetical protein